MIQQVRQRQKDQPEREKQWQQQHLQGGPVEKDR